MTNSVQRFNGRASDYDRFRERYSADILLPRFRMWCGLTPRWIVADIGAGTGMLADVFLANGNPVLAVEPNAEMREACARIHAHDARIRIIEGAAEATSLPARSVDLIAIGRSFHWFDDDSAIEEFRRVLKPDGWVASVAFGRASRGTEANIAVEALVNSFLTARDDYPGAYAKYTRLPELLTRDFHHEEIESSIPFTEAELFGLLRSLSHVPIFDDRGLAELEQRSGEVFARYAAGGLITLATRYWINIGRLS